MNILFVTSTRIGDAVLSTCLLSHLVAEYSNARFTVACGPLPAPLFAAVPEVERVIPLNKQRFSGHWISLWADVMSTRWDLIVDLRASVLAWTLWAKSRKTLRSSDEGETIHRVVELNKFFNLTSTQGPKLWLPEASMAKAASNIPEGNPVIGLGVTANWLPKIWPAQNFADVVERLTSADGLLPSARVAVFGADEERALAKPVLDRLAEQQRIDLVGQNDLLAVAACLSICDLFIGNDSGLMHMAAAVQTPTIGLFGPSPALRYGPWGDHCAAVESSESYAELVGAPDFDHRANLNLMQGVSVEAVEQAAHDLCAKIARAENG
ncbi:MAG: glycosyltransferase family 9 protein [Alphaproteobacteria bacterium]|nr:glycosyltransferase family 9 protein [Alphaproteobacteria bacterium]